MAGPLSDDQLLQTVNQMADIFLGLKGKGLTADEAFKLIGIVLNAVMPQIAAATLATLPRPR
jgi:hypothetical protein